MEEVQNKEQFIADRGDVGFFVLPKDDKDGHSEKSCSATVFLSQDNNSLQSYPENLSESEENESFSGTLSPKPRYQTGHVHTLVSKQPHQLADTSILDSTKHPLVSRQEPLPVLEKVARTATKATPLQRYITAKSESISDNLKKNQVPSTSRRSATSVTFHCPIENPTLLSPVSSRCKKDQSNRTEGNPVSHPKKTSSVYERLATSNTKNMEQRRKLEREQNARKNSKQHDRNPAAFKYFIATARMPDLPEPVQPKQKKSKCSASDLDRVFSRLAHQDTIASSRKKPAKHHHIILTEYEKTELKEESRIQEQEERQKMRTSAAFFDHLSKGTTMSMLYRKS